MSNEGSGNGGIDVKYGITQNLTADFTYNTDFAQVEVDERQVNLTRFPLFFPEKREFFLEGRGIFGFARGGVTRRPGGPGGATGGVFGDVNVPQLFYSRKIGLEQGRVVPIIGGARVTGKVGQFDVGALNIHTDDEMVSASDPTNFTVVRLRRDILRRSSVGGMFTNRSVSRVAPGEASQAYGRRRHLRVPRQRQLRQLLRADPSAEPRVRGQGHELPGEVRVPGRPLRPAGGPSAGRGQLLPRGGLPPARQLPPHLRVGPVQPPARDGERPAVQPGGARRLLS